MSGGYLDSASKAHQITADAGSVTFSQGERDGEIEFEVRVSKPVADETAHVPKFSVYLFDCETPIGTEGVVTASNDVGIDRSEPFEGTEYDVRPVVVDVDVTKLSQATDIFQYLNDGSQGELKICVKAEIGSITIDADTESSISFVNVMFYILLKMSEDFSNASYTVTVEESSAVGGTQQDVNVEYGCRSSYIDIFVIIE